MEGNSDKNTLTTRQDTNYQEWFISALKSTKVLDDGNADEKHLLQNCVACQNEVKRLLEKNENQWIRKYEEFRFNSTIILFLSCRSVKSVLKITLSKDLASLIKTLPSISETSAFLVLQRLKNYLCLRGILPWLPVPTLFSLMSKFFFSAKLVTPISLAISYEFLIGLSNSIMYSNGGDNACEVINAFDTFLEFFASMEHNFDNDKNIKVEAYFFLYVFKVLLIYIKISVTKTPEDLSTLHLGLQLKNLYKESPRVYPESLEEIIEDFVKKLVTILCEISPLITSHVWIDWHSIKLPPLEFPESQSHTSVIKLDSDDVLVQKSVQLEISQTAFKINKYLVNEEHAILNTQDFPEFFEFVKSIAVDPDHDPDYDFSNEKLIESINNTEVKRKKFINILFTREEIFESAECVDCAKTYGLLLKKECIINLLLKAIYTLKNGNAILEEWVQIILDFAKKIPTEELSSIIRNELNNGKMDILKTKHFDQDLTFVFNQLSESEDNEYNSLLAWLCLQDGKVVIKRFIEHVISLSGLASVAASALKTVYYVCRTEENKDISVLTSCLLSCWKENMPEQQQKEFLSLILKLLENNNAFEAENPVQELEILPIKILEMLDYLILPKLKSEIQKGLCVPAAIEILKAIMNLYPNVIVAASPKFTSLLISLVFLYNNCNYLRNPDYSTTLNLRSSIQFIIIKMMKQIIQRKDDFNKVVAYIEHYLSRKDLHPRCLLLLSPVIDFVEPDSLSDVIFSHIFWGSADSIFLQQITKSLPDATRMQWVWSLVMHLPHCNYEEWRHAVKLTYIYLNQSVGFSIMVIPTLKLMQEALFLICTTTSSNSLDLHDTEVPPAGLQESQESLLSIDCCFKMFSLAATSFINERIREESSEQKFYLLVNIFIWWCKSFKGFSCNPELPCIFLSSVSNLIQDLFNSESLIVTESSDLVNLENKNFLKKSGIRVQSLNDSVTETCNENVHLEQKPKFGSEVDGRRSNSEKSKAEFLSKVRFMEKIEQMVKSFIVYVPVNKVGATVAGKLKALYEKHDCCDYSIIDK